ncbi:hypothetical protein ACIF9R_37165 [Streptomyces sp. NPDC086080]|uniref:hypothetical protein n=1 Tax=Streptomyces sp. NPDC086080 TaxID=3365748 RepID=UPI0037D6CBF4
MHCRRTRTDEASADHLYIGQALGQWLVREGQRGTDITYPDLGSGPGGAVEARFGAGLRLIRVQLSHLPVAAWEAARAELSGTHPNVQWAYGPHSGLGHGEAQAAGHAVRFICRTEGGNRVVYVGTQSTDHTIEWTTLDRCRLTDEGIAVPSPTESAAVVVFPPYRSQ